MDTERDSFDWDPSDRYIGARESNTKTRPVGQTRRHRHVADVQMIADTLGHVVTCVICKQVWAPR